jgi:transposase InsO family protein
MHCCITLIAAAQRAVPAADGRQRRRLFDEPIGNVWDNAAMESFFSSLKTERTSSKTYRTRNEAKADVFDYIERFYNSKRRHSTIGYLSPMEFERQAGFA